MASPKESNWRDPYLLDEDELGEETAIVAARIEDKSGWIPKTKASLTRGKISAVKKINQEPGYRRPDNGIALGLQRQGTLRPPNGIPITLEKTTRVVIAIDYGTTYTGLAVAQTSSGHANLNEIEVLQDWGPNGNNQSKVRTMISYVKSATGRTQWGSAVSNHATAMVNTKIELDPQASRYDELELALYLLMGTGNLAFEHLKKIGPDPAYPSASPKEIVQEYLTHIRESACRKGVFTKVDLSKLVETKTPVDIVVTVPANWSYQASDATFKAVRGAGFDKANFPTLRDTILVSEPEAASFFAIRDHLATTDVDLRIDDCFILCDAGGGTVDVVTYQIKKVKPHLEIERVTEPDSRKCGSAFIDTAFKNWLRDTLGVDDYGKLDPLNTQGRITAHTMESGPIRKLVQDFIIRKQAFSDNSQDVLLDLPEPLQGMDKEGRVREGELVIYRKEMRELFDECIGGVIELLNSQIKKLKQARNRIPQEVFLVGGFGASPYLQSLLEETLGLRRGSNLRRPNPEKSLTAVVQGAVIYGVEKSRHDNVRYMSAAEDSYAICLNGHFEWVIRRGDLILSTEKRSVFSKSFSMPLKSCPSKQFEVPIYKYAKRREDDDDVPDWWEDGQHNVVRVGVVKCDVSTTLDQDLRISRVLQRQGNRDIGPFTCHFQLSTSSLEAKVLHRKTVLGRCEICAFSDSVGNSSSRSWG